jgi:hypothetical protein
MTDNKIDEILKSVYASDSSVDIREHLATLKAYASECDKVTELGVRWVVSTWAFMAAKPKSLNSFDLDHFSNYGVSADTLYEAAKDSGVEFVFHQENVLTTNNLKDTDLLFIDTLHSYKQLKMELYLHASKVKKYIIFHDVVSFGESDEGEVPYSDDWPEDLKKYYSTLKDNTGINLAIAEFLTANPEWRIADMYTNNNGLLVIRRASNA